MPGSVNGHRFFHEKMFLPWRTASSNVIGRKTGRGGENDDVSR